MTLAPAISAIVLGVLGSVLLAGTAAPPTITEPPVYHPQRLVTIQSSITVTGLVATTPVHERDGDATFELQSGTHAYHVEIVCAFPPILRAARDACRGYTNHIPIPRRGDRVRVTGRLVRDLRHEDAYPELEIHPVRALEILR